MEIATARRFTSIVTAINVLVATGFSVAGLISPESIAPGALAASGAVATFASYAAVRTLALCVLSLIVILRGSNVALLTLGALAGVIQFGDTAVGLLQHDIGKTAGPFFIAVIQVIALLSLKRAVDTEG